MVIATPRLRLVTLPADDHRRLAQGLNPATVVAPDEFLNGPDPVPVSVHERQAARAEADPANSRWLLRAMLDHDNIMVGNIGFHDLPLPLDEALTDGEFSGDRPHADRPVAEFGYTVFTAHRRRGYGTEAATALVDWALGQQGLGGVLATTDPDNTPSQRILSTVGLVVIGRCPNHEPDRPDELVWWRPA